MMLKLRGCGGKPAMRCWKVLSPASFWRCCSRARNRASQQKMTKWRGSKPAEDDAEVERLRREARDALLLRREARDALLEGAQSGKLLEVLQQAEQASRR
eukprot:TRINITY_DN2149_c0_g1_i5.p1 TRINITY_DN2149_c0_g1~~TRINITY_DN2149_c0_g1_i5.p1  ORF type:complete len:100 (-),score=28.86 TRINITY_DN2149_c0_g1_i5:179-478(-)